MISHWSLSESKPSQVSRTLLSILSDLNIAAVWMVSTCPLISKSSSPCTNPFEFVPSAPIKIGITVSFMFHSCCFFFNSRARSRYLSFFSFYSVVSRDCKIHNSASTPFFIFIFIYFFKFFLLIITSSGRLAEIK